MPSNLTILHVAINGLAVIMASSLASCESTQVADLRFVEARLVPTQQNLIDLTFSPEATGMTAPFNTGTVALRITFSSAVDLIDLAKSKTYTMGGDATYCDVRRGATTIVGGGFVYSSGRAVRPDYGSIPAHSQKSGARINYQLYLPLSRPPVADGTLKSPAFDLSQDERDICISIRGGNMLWGSFKSNVFVVPKAAIAASLLRR